MEGGCAPSRPPLLFLTAVGKVGVVQGVLSCPPPDPLPLAIYLRGQSLIKREGDEMGGGCAPSWPPLLFLTAVGKVGGAGGFILHTP